MGPYCWVRVYVVWALRNRADRQLADVNQIVAAHPDYAPFRLMWARVLAHQCDNLDTARDDLDHALRLDPRLAERTHYYRRRSDVRLAAGDPDGALDELAASLKVDPKNRDTYFRRAEILTNQEAYQGAVIDLREGLKYDFGMEKKELAAVRARMAYALVRQRQFRQAEAELVIAERYQRQHPDVLRMRAMLAVAQGDAAVLDRLLAEVPRRDNGLRADLLDQRGVLHLYNDNPAAALADFEQIVALMPGHPCSYISRGAARSSMGDLAGAAHSLSK
jgi:tetratricopeptide (TPR) repeat protein